MSTGKITCPGVEYHGNPFRYCACGWREPEPDAAADAPLTLSAALDKVSDDMSRYTAEEGARIVAEVRQHPKRDLIRSIAEATFDLANENGPSGGGMWWHLSWAYALVEALPALTLTERTGSDG